MTRWVVVSVILAHAAVAGAQGAGRKVAAMTDEAMEKYDMMEFEEAKSVLSEAISLAEGAGLQGREVARAYLSLGIVFLSGLGDEDSASRALARAVRIDPDIEVDIAYRTQELESLLIEARESGGSMGDDFDTGGDACAADGLLHDLVDSAPKGKSLPMLASVGEAIGASRVVIYYRPEGDDDFLESEMELAGGCQYRGEIPANALRGNFLHYYVAAEDGSGSPIVSRGTSGSPNILEIFGSGGSSGASDSDDPLDGSIGKSASAGGDPKLFLSVALGAGGGYVSGQTELQMDNVACCFAPALMHLFPEVGYYLSRQMSVSLAARLGFPMGANLEGHATFAPAGLIRIRYALDKSGEGLEFSGAIGGGIIRNTVKLENPPAEGMDTDTTASGPVLVGGGAGYKVGLAGPMQFVAELNSLIAMPAGFEEIGACPGAGCTRPNFGLEFDVNLGVLLAF